MRKSTLALALALVASPALAQEVWQSQLYPAKAPTATVATLPACTASLQGVIFLVTDALLPAFLGTVTGGGAVVVKVTCNGSNWIVG